jgi:hypothetical protein
MKAQIRGGDLSQPPSQTVVIRMNVRDHQVAYIRQPNIKRAKVALERVQRVCRVPAAVDQQIAIVRADEIGVDMTQWAVVQREW